jgi:hypothetical protein
MRGAGFQHGYVANTMKIERSLFALPIDPFRQLCWNSTYANLELEMRTILDFHKDGSLFQF